MEKERQEAVINATPNCTFGSLRGNGNAFTALRLYFLIELMFICLCACMFVCLYVYMFVCLYV